MKMTSGRGGGREEGRGRAIVGHRQQAKGGSQCQTGLLVALLALACSYGLPPAPCPALLALKQNNTPITIPTALFRPAAPATLPSPAMATLRVADRSTGRSRYCGCPLYHHTNSRAENTPGRSCTGGPGHKAQSHVQCVSGQLQMKPWAIR